MFKLEEGIHLIAYVTDKKSGESTTIEDYDYNSKKQFEQELKNNGYKVISILDNRDMFLLDNTDYTRVSQIQKELRQLKKDIEDSKDKYPALYKSYINNYNNLKDVYDKVMKISLTEGYVLKEYKMENLLIFLLMIIKKNYKNLWMNYNQSIEI